jgi:hypothetical protein
VSRHFLGEADLFEVAVEGSEAYLVPGRARRGLSSPARRFGSRSNSGRAGVRRRDERSLLRRAQFAIVAWTGGLGFWTHKGFRDAMGTFSIWHWIIVIALILVLFGRGKVSELMGTSPRASRASRRA